MDTAEILRVVESANNLPKLLNIQALDPKLLVFSTIDEWTGPCMDLSPAQVHKGITGPPPLWNMFQ